MNDFDNIKQRTNIAQFIPPLVQGKTSGSGDTIGINPCPICKHNDCFKISKKNQVYNCFSCGSAGNIFNFIQDFYSLMDWHDILKKASELTGVKLQNSEEIKDKSPKLRDHQQIFNLAADFYNKLLLNSPDALKILSSTRKYTLKTIKEFKLGYTGPDGWNKLTDYLIEHEYKTPELLTSGLAKRREKQGSQLLADAFGPNLFVFPHLVGRHVKDFSCKDALKHQKKAGDKIYNPRLNSEFRIGDVHFFNQDALYHQDVAIVEGQHDAIQLMRQVGKKCVLATTGGPTEKQITWLKKHAAGKNFYLGFDFDRAKDPGQLSAGDRYRRKMILELLTIAGNVKVMVWQDDAKDIDEYLRTVKKVGE